MAIRGSRFKLVVDFASSQDQLYDLKSDPTEMCPLPEDAEKSMRRSLLDAARCQLNDSVQSRDPKLRLSARLRDLQLESVHSAAKVSA
jgi:hypothetical protein